MKRIELFEFEDFHWLPQFIRSGITNLIKVFHQLIGTSAVLSALILEVRRKYNFDQVVDLGSGSGGPMPEVIQAVNRAETGKPLELLLSDFHPSPTVVKEVNNNNWPHIRYQETSVDARNIEKTPKGLKTMVASFHHMKPAVAKEILQSAQQSKQPILIYEIAKNNIPILLWVLLLPLSLAILVLMCWFMTPFVKPLSLKQIVFTYFIPLIPLVYAWDGQASLMRTYTFDDLQILIGDRSDEQYTWEIADALKENGKKAGYYIMGYPK